MEPKEPICSLHLRKFPKEVRNRLKKISIDLDEDVQDLVPKWLRERLEQEEAKLQMLGKKGAKQK